jgi:hypothetical protein
MARISRKTHAESALIPLGHRPQIILRGRLARLPSAPSISQSEDEKDNERTNGGAYNGRNNSGAKMDAQVREEPTADKRSNDADGDVGDNAKSGTLDNLSCKPACD